LAIAKLRESRTNVAKILSPVGSEEPSDVFEQQRLGCRTLLTKPSHQIEERPHRSGVLTRKPSSIACEREIDAGEGSGSEPDIRREAVDGNVPDVSDQQMIAAKTGPVHLGLFGRDVIGEGAVPSKWLDCLSY